LVEANNINQSLSVLGACIRALGDISNGKPAHVPYRESKLTEIIKESLSGNSRSALISTATSQSADKISNISTLEFAKAVKIVKTRAIINQLVTFNESERVTRLETQVYQLSEEKKSAFYQLDVMAQDLKKSNKENLLLTQQIHTSKSQVQQLTEKNKSLVNVISHT
jgi:hypothetical protein